MAALPVLDIAGFLAGPDTDAGRRFVRELRDTLHGPGFCYLVGYGIPAPNPSWGGMIAAGADVIRRFPGVMVAPVVTLFLTVFSFNLVGDWLAGLLGVEVTPGVDWTRHFLQIIAGMVAVAVVAGIRGRRSTV